MSRLRMSFVFSAGDQEERRQSETEKRKKAKSIEQTEHKHSSIAESKLQPDKNTHTLRTSLCC